METPPLPRILVDRSELDTALLALRKFLKRKTAVQAVVTVESGLLCIDAGGIVVRASAAGTWPGQARVSCALLLAYAGQLPPGDPLELTVLDSHLHLGRASVYCNWTATEQDWIPQPTVRLAINASLLDVLALAQNHSEEEIRQSALESQVRSAREDRDRRIGRAATALEPMGVTRGDLQWLVEECVKRSQKRTP